MLMMMGESLNPYFIGLSILIILSNLEKGVLEKLSQSLFYWIIYSYKSSVRNMELIGVACLNPYFIGLSILIPKKLGVTLKQVDRLNPYFIGLSILIY